MGVQQAIIFPAMICAQRDFRHHRIITIVGASGGLVESIGADDVKRHQADHFI